jgi:outer membrane immunogenic protein
MKSLTHLFVVFCACNALALIAFAGPEALPSGKEMKEIAPMPPPPGCHWTGLYLGLNGGYLWTNDNRVDTDSEDVFGNPALGNGVVYGIAAADLATFSLRNSNDGFIGGGQIGYNLEFWRLVAGVEADIQGVFGSDNTTTADSSLKVAGGPTEFLIQTARVRREMPYFGTLRGRLGFAVTPCLLVYGTGGLAYGEVSSRTSITQFITNAPGVPNPYSASGRYENPSVGWTLGGGLEWMFWGRWSVKAEYLYYDLGDVHYRTKPLNNFNFAGTLFTTTQPFSRTSFDGNIVRGGLNFHF